ncbi:Fanconi anemia group A protein homolog [Penaeus vannamei]|uniref:Fanconi anemia group A protein homolog n=1 Tax=Penaeus vannamei TaxID=6689 RepID=UPI00387F51E0
MALLNVSSSLEFRNQISREIIVYLARARLKDLKETLDPNTAIHQSEKEKSKVADEVETAITQYAQISKVPNFVLEASIFRKPYFCSSFLPTFLTPRPMPDAPDAARANLFVDALHLSGKLPSNMLQKYIELCQKECTENS